MLWGLQNPLPSPPIPPCSQENAVDSSKIQSFPTFFYITLSQEKNVQVKERLLTPAHICSAAKALPNGTPCFVHRCNFLILTRICNLHISHSAVSGLRRTCGMVACSYSQKVKRDSSQDVSPLKMLQQPSMYIWTPPKTQWKITEHSSPPVKQQRP